jgi:hypothetical protein
MHRWTLFRNTISPASSQKGMIRRDRYLALIMYPDYLEPAHYHCYSAEELRLADKGHHFLGGSQLDSLRALFGDVA